MSRPVEHSTAGGPIEVDGAELERVRILSALFDGPADRETKLRLRWVIGYRELVEIIEGPSATAAIPADQSQLLAPRDGLAGSDEAVKVVLVPNQGRPSQVIIVGARMTEDVLDLVGDVEDGFAEVVRAEAVAGERLRLRSNETVGAVAKYLNAALLSGRSITAGQAARDISEIIAAGSVLVATPAEPVLDEERS